MDLRAFKNTPEVVPLLVQLYESQKLYRLAYDKRPVAKAELIEAVGGLLDVKLSPRESDLLTDVLVALARQAEKDLRQALADRLAVIPNVPLRLVLHLANDEFSVAEPILSKSPVLTDVDLIYLIKAQGPAYWQAIAARENLSSQIIDILADTRDPGTGVTLSRNERITLTSHAISILGDMAKTSEDIARPLLTRPELPESVAQSLYRHVGAELKSYIQINFNLDNGAPEQAVDDLVLEFTETRKQAPFLPTEEMEKASRAMAAVGMLNMNTMLETLKRGQIASFVAMFAEYTGLPVDRVHEFMQQPCPKGLAIACRAFHIQKSDFSRIYLLTNRMRSREQLVNHKAMLKILAYFDNVKPEIAKRIVQRETSKVI